MKNIPLLFLLLLCSFGVFAQSSNSIKGGVIDTATNTKLVNTSVSVLNSKDSTLVNYTRAAADGSFSMNNLPSGKFILLVSYHGYADYAASFTLDPANSSRDFGQIKMLLKAKLLEEVLINGAAAIKIKGDTTEFNARSYKIQPNDRVEDLIKQFPGITVDQNGKITAQGQQVTKFLVDGEEFFGDDPTLVTRNIRADMVDKVQLYDKKSDQATFTGVDDGQRTKTMNLTLKADSKNGIFGKVDGGKAPADEFYQGQGMFNAFKAKQKFSAYGTVGNTNRTGLTFEDGNKLGTSNISVDGGGIIFAGGDDGLDSFDGRYNGRGIPTTQAGGVHYDGKWNSDKESINMNYKIGSMGVDGTENNLKQNNYTTGAINTIENKTNNNSVFRQKVDATYQLTISPTSNLKISADGTLKNTKTNTGFLANNTRANNINLNSQSRNINIDDDQKLFNMSAFLTKKFKKVGRTASFQLSQSFNDTQSDGYVYSTNNFYNTAGALDSTRIVDQYKPTTGNSYALNSNMTYTEPLSKTFSLVLNYGLVLNNSTSNNRSFNASAPGKYTILDNVYSNNFDLNVLTNQGGAIFNYTKKNTVLNFGTRVSGVSFDQTDLNTGKEYDRNYLNWSPQASYTYRVASRKSISFRYSGTTTQPSLTQLQPIKVNTDPLNITLGNPDLKPSYRSSFSAGFTTFKFSSTQSISFQASFSFAGNMIINNTVLDGAGKATSQYVNLKGKNPPSYNMYMFFSKVLKKSGISIDPSISFFGNTSYGYSNNVLNKTDNKSFNGSMYLTKSVPKKYDFSFSFGPNFTISKSSLGIYNNNSSGFSTYGNVNIFLPGKLQIASNANYRYTGKTQTFAGNGAMTINSTLTKKFLKKDNLSLALSGNDLLNQNVGFTRTQNNVTLSQSNYTTIQRYFLLSLVWDFTQMGGAAAKKQ